MRQTVRTTKHTRSKVTHGTVGGCKRELVYTYMQVSHNMEIIPRTPGYLNPKLVTPNERQAATSGLEPCRCSHRAPGCSGAWALLQRGQSNSYLSPNECVLSVLTGARSDCQHLSLRLCIFPSADWCDSTGLCVRIAFWDEARA